MSEIPLTGGPGTAPPKRIDAPSSIARGTASDELAVLPQVDRFDGEIKPTKTISQPPPTSQTKIKPPSVGKTSAPFSIYTADPKDPKLSLLTKFQRVEGYELAALMLFTINDYAKTNDVNSKEMTRQKLLDQWLTVQALQGAGQNPGLIGFVNSLGINEETVKAPSLFLANPDSGNINLNIGSLLKEAADLRAELKKEIKPVVAETNNPSGA